MHLLFGHGGEAHENNLREIHRLPGYNERPELGVQWYNERHDRFDWSREHCHIHLVGVRMFDDVPPVPDEQFERGFISLR